jgi:hypothetical protein
MTETGAVLPSTFAAGVRLPYAALPEAVWGWVADRLGGPVVEVVDQRGGFSPGVAATVRAASGPGLFVKAVTDVIGPGLHNPDGLRFARNERDRALRLPEVPGVLRPNGSTELVVDGDHWVVLTFPLLAGSTPQHPWSPVDAVRCLDRLAAVRAALTPSPWPEDPEATAAMVDFLSGWQQLADAPDGGDAADAAEEPDPWRTDPWIVAHLEELLGMERQLTGRLAGDTLSHWDLRADNIVLTADDVWFVDWAHARNAAGWLDAALLTADIVASGADRGDGGRLDVAGLVDRHPAFAGAGQETVLAVLSSLAATLHCFSRRPATPGLPTIRGWQDRTAAAILRYVRRSLDASAG